MGACDSSKNENSDDGIKPHTKNINHQSIIMKKLNEAAKSLCKIIVSSNKSASGFFILLFKEGQPFPCLITNEHVVKKKMIEDKVKIIVLYDNETKDLEIKLNTEERFIKVFSEFNMDVTVIGILPKDNISKEYFLSAFKDYIDNFDIFLDKKIMILEYPNGVMSVCSGEIIRISKNKKYEFIHNLGNDKGSSGSPIFLEGTTRVIGIHKGANNDG